jgi:hypothetical protein
MTDRNLEKWSRGQTVCRKFHGTSKISCPINPNGRAPEQQTTTSHKATWNNKNIEEKMGEPICFAYGDSTCHWDV